MGSRVCVVTLSASQALEATPAISREYCKGFSEEYKSNQRERGNGVWTRDDHDVARSPRLPLSLVNFCNMRVSGGQSRGLSWRM